MIGVFNCFVQFPKISVKPLKRKLSAKKFQFKKKKTKTKLNNKKPQGNPKEDEHPQIRKLEALHKQLKTILNQNYENSFKNLQPLLVDDAIKEIVQEISSICAHKSEISDPILKEYLKHRDLIWRADHEIVDGFKSAFTRKDFPQNQKSETIMSFVNQLRQQFDEFLQERYSFYLSHFQAVLEKCKIEDHPRNDENFCYAARIQNFLGDLSRYYEEAILLREDEKTGKESQISLNLNTKAAISPDNTTSITSKINTTPLRLQQPEKKSQNGIQYYQRPVDEQKTERNGIFWKPSCHYTRALQLNPISLNSNNSMSVARFLFLVFFNFLHFFCAYFHEIEISFIFHVTHHKEGSMDRSLNQFSFHTNQYAQVGPSETPS